MTAGFNNSEKKRKSSESIVCIGENSSLGFIEAVHQWYIMMALFAAVATALWERGNRGLGAELV